MGIKFSQFGAAATPTQNDVVVGLQDGTNRKFSLGALLAWIKAQISPGDIGAVPVERTVNNKSLVQNINLSASDVGAVDTDDVGIAGGVASLDGDGKVPSSQLPPISSDAADISYDNTQSGLNANDVQEAIDELAAGAVSVDLSTIAPVEDSTTATQAHPLGTIFYLNDLLYRALADIPAGGTINTADGGNAVQTSVAQNFQRIVALTSAQYESLSSAEKTADIVYVITDDNTVPAENVSYDGTQSHLAAGNIQQAVDVLADAVGNKQAKILVSGLLKGDGQGGISVAVKGTDYGTYSKPSGGIPKTDLAPGVIPSNPATEQQIAPIETGTTASQAYAIGDFFCRNGLLYKAIAPIAVGQTFTVDTNCEQTTVMTENQAKQDILTFDTAPTADSPNPVTSDGINSAIKARYSTNTIFDTITDVHTDVTITMDHSFTSFKFLMIIFNTSSSGSASKRMPLVLATNALPQGGFYPLINSDGSGYIRINYISGQAKQVRFQATSFASLYVTSIIGLN